MRQIINSISTLIFICISAVFFQNCGIVERPQSADLSSFSNETYHEMANVKAMECQACHEPDRKFAEHYAGQDCKGCHTPGTSWWQGTTASHDPTPVQCNLCHGASGSSPKFPVTHHNVFGSDCIECHQASIGNSYANFTGAMQKHTPALFAARNCATCHADGRPFDRFPPVHPVTNNQDCVSCHMSTVNSGYTKWLVGEYRHSAAQLTTCATCHNDARPQDSFPAGHLAIGATDCSSCHQATINMNFVNVTSSQLNWRGARFAHNAAIISARNCASCHGVGQSRPSLPANHINTTGLDCSQCHQASINGGFINWAGGVFAHNAALIAGQNCASCHAADRPPVVNLTRINPSINDARVVDKTHFVGKDCYRCHNAPPMAVNRWRGNNLNQYEHTNASGVQINFCLTCHIRDEHVGQDGSNANDIVADGKCQQCHTRKRSWSDQNRNNNL